MSIVCVSLLLFGPATARGPESSDFAFAPAAGPESPLRLEGTTWVDETPGHALHLLRLSDEDRQAYLQRVTGAVTDPFASPPDQKPRFLTFLIRLENRETPSLMLNAQQCWLVTNKGEHLTPVGLEELRAGYGILDREMPPAYDRVRPAVFEYSWTLGQGESASGLLIYRAFKPKTKSFQIDLQLTRSTGDVIRRSAPYVKKKPGD